MSKKKKKEAPVSPSLTLEQRVESLEKNVQFICRGMDSLMEALKKGIVVPVHKKGINPTQHVLRGLTNKLGLKSVEDTINLLKALYAACPGSVVALILNFIARDMDEDYDNHIKDADVVYTHSTLDGKIYEVKKEDIKSYKNFAAFRTKDSAIIAVKVLNSIIKNVLKK